ncbi:DUF4411 family protein [Clostridium sp. MCC353]|uniref:DUF4411 family protein n=1 Tax=Clostridium sp. MCC353 TaxID=2592646 RepID=UPI001C00CAB5|nr:DUF4411 family protein [Clostridium sp. MCC353]MBT9775171.1 DUF4411 family protein [Clostridium sp. MCC353]
MVEEKFLLDANSLITPYENFYPFDLAPGFWRQLVPLLSTESVAILDSVKAEILKGDDELTAWLKSIEELNVCSRKSSDVLRVYANILNYIQTSEKYTERALREWSKETVADPWLIAAASTYGYTIITFEKPLGIISNATNRPKIPDIAKMFNVKCEDLYYFMRSAGVRL